MNHKQRILYIHHSGAIGGAPRSLLFLMDTVRNYFPVELVCLSKGPVESLFKAKEFHPKYWNGIHLFHGSTVAEWSLLRWLKQMFWLLPSIYQARKMLLANPSDLIHVNSSCIVPVIIATWLEPKKRKVICHIREPILPGFQGAMLRFAVQKVDSIIAISKFDAQSVGHSSKANIVYNSYPDVIFDKLDKRNLSRLSKERSLLFAARVTKSNGVDVLLEALSKLDLNSLGLTIQILGFRIEHNASEYERAVRLKLSEITGVVCLDQVSNVTDYYSQCDGVIIPFLEPHSSRTQIEAMAFGKPMIASNIPSINEVSRNQVDSFLVEPGNANDLANAIQLFATLEDSKLLEMGNASFVQGKKFFDLENNNNQILEIYRVLLSHSVVETG